MWAKFRWLKSRAMLTEVESILSTVGITLTMLAFVGLIADSLFLDRTYFKSLMIPFLLGIAMQFLILPVKYFFPEHTRRTLLEVTRHLGDVPIILRLRRDDGVVCIESDALGIALMPLSEFPAVIEAVAGMLRQGSLATRKRKIIIPNSTASLEEIHDGDARNFELVVSRGESTIRYKPSLEELAELLDAMLYVDEAGRARQNAAR